MAGNSEGQMPSVAPFKLDSSFWESQTRPDTTVNLLPPPSCPPKSWHRIAVPALTRRYTIWKRAGGDLGAVSSSNQKYASAVAELNSRGDSQRKRARGADFIPVWGSTQWDPRVEELGDGKTDLEEAKASVMAGRETGPDVAVLALESSRPATFPEEKLKWVPRKRYSSRWPVGSAREGTSTIATAVLGGPQPPVDVSTIQAPTDAQDDAQRADEKQMRRRSTRRMSRRVSFAPLDDTFIHHSPVATRSSPLKAAATPRRLSPRKVSGSPQKAFTLVATPSKVLFRSPAFRFPSPAIFQSPIRAQASPPSPIDEARETEAEEPSSFLSESSHLLFDQPVPEVSVEPEHETSRRTSLHNARRRERRRSSGVRRLVDLEDPQKPAPRRRHSLFPQPGAATAEKTSRRHTLDVFGGSITLVLEEDAEEEETAAGCSPVEAAENIAEVVVDVGANLDIFGVSAVTQRKRRRGSVQREVQAEMDDLSETRDTRFDDAVIEADELPDSPPDDAGEDTAEDVHVDLDLDGFGDKDPIECEPTVEEPTPALASVRGPLLPSAGSDDDSVDALIHNMDCTEGLEGEQCEEEMFAQDPEGLSTIFEESEVMSPETQAVVDSSATILEPPPAHIDRDCPNSGDGLAGPNITSQQGAAESSGGMESPLPDLDQTCEEHELDSQHQSSPPSSNDGDSVVTPEDDFCGTISVEDLAAVGDEFKAALEYSPKQATGGISCLEMPSSPSAQVANEDTLTCTPPLATVLPTEQVQDVVEDTETVPETPPIRGFTPVKSHFGSQSAEVEFLGEPEQEDDSDEEDSADEDMGLAMDYEPTVPLQLDDPTLASEPDCASVAADLQEDSETEMLRKFVTRVSASKSAKAAATAAAAALSNGRNLRPKRRSGSTGSATASTTGSPAAQASSSERADTAPPTTSPLRSNSRVALGEMDANSPSPTKKRKAHTGSSDKIRSDDLFKGNPDLFSAEISPPRSKRVKRVRTVNGQSATSLTDAAARSDQQQPTQETAEDADAGALPSLHRQALQPRRSTRTRSARVALKSPAPSANSIALSHIPVRLAGAASMLDMDKDMPTPVVVPRKARTTAEEKDLAATTQVNTRKNKGTAVQPKVVLARQAKDPAAFRMKELKGIHDAREQRAASHGAGEDGGEEAGKPKDGRRKARKEKGVRWAAELVRFQGDEPSEASSPPSSNASKSALTGARRTKITPVPLPTIPASFMERQQKLKAEAHVQHVASAAAEEAEKSTGKQQPVTTTDAPAVQAEREDKPAPARRTRASRLQAPTPVSKKMLEAKPATAAPTPSAAGVAQMATRRTRIATLGMGVNGTPAPKRRGRGAV